MQCTIELPEEQARRLAEIAAQQRRSVDELLQAAVGDYLARHPTPTAWTHRLADAVARIRADIPTDIPPEEIEADVTAAWDEYRAERAANS